MCNDMPKDYEACGECGYDHEYECEEAHAWHLAHPCSYCDYNHETKTHESSCPVANIYPSDDVSLSQHMYKK